MSMTSENAQMCFHYTFSQYLLIETLQKTPHESVKTFLRYLIVFVFLLPVSFCAFCTFVSVMETQQMMTRSGFNTDVDLGSITLAETELTVRETGLEALC